MKSLLRWGGTIAESLGTTVIGDAQGEMRETGVKNGRKERNVAKKLSNSNQVKTARCTKEAWEDVDKQGRAISHTDIHNVGKFRPVLSCCFHSSCSRAPVTKKPYGHESYFLHCRFVCISSFVFILLSLFLSPYISLFLPPLSSSCLSFILFRSFSVLSYILFLSSSPFISPYISSSFLLCLCSVFPSFSISSFLSSIFLLHM
jgi:hypothetical protein